MTLRDLIVPGIILVIGFGWREVFRPRHRNRLWEEEKAKWGGLTWTCHICGNDRPDPLISVISFAIKDIPGAVRNVRYCNDRPSCYGGARQKALSQK